MIRQQMNLIRGFMMPFPALDIESLQPRKDIYIYIYIESQFRMNIKIDTMTGRSVALIPRRMATPHHCRDMKFTIEIIQLGGLRLNGLDSKRRRGKRVLELDWQTSPAGRNLNELNNKSRREGRVAEPTSEERVE